MVVPASAQPLKNIVLVHGAWVDGSGWQPVYDILIKTGLNVTMGFGMPAVLFLAEVNRALMENQMTGMPRPAS